MKQLLGRAFSYRLNAGAMQELRERSLPQDVLDALAGLRDRTFGSRSALLAAAAAASPAAPRFADDIAGCARVLRPKRIARGLGEIWALHIAASRLNLPWRSFILLRPLMFFLRFRVRYWRFTLAGASHAGVREQRNSNTVGFHHNRKQVLSFQEGHRNRTESLINVLRSIEGFDFAGAKVLCVGPRNEAEVLLLELYGMPLRNIEAIDLFSYSPVIQVMDMNELRFPDSRFDVYYSSAVIKYSPDINRTVAEAIRVTRPGGLMVFGFMFVAPSDVEDPMVPRGSELSGGVGDLLQLFDGHVEYVFWQQEFPFAPGEIRASVIFRLVK